MTIIFFMIIPLVFLTKPCHFSNRALSIRKTLKLSSDLPFIGIHISVVFWLSSQHKTDNPLLSHTGVICLIYFQLIPDWSSLIRLLQETIQSEKCQEESVWQIVSDLISINAFSKCPQQEGYSGFASWTMHNFITE